MGYYLNSIYIAWLHSRGLCDQKRGAMNTQAKPGTPSGTKHKASPTASFAAIHRYMATKEKNPHFRGPDSLAQFFLPAWGRFLLKFPFIHGRMRRRVPGVYEYVTVRTRFFDSLFQRALEENIPQIVLLGAGYDTRALRFSRLIRQTEIFELDAPAVQERKKAAIAKHGLPRPEQLSFVPITFGRQDLGQTLFQAGYDRSGRTLFLWEGVTYYLDEATVRRTLAFIRDNSGPGSSVAFDYFLASVVRGESTVWGARQARESVADHDEPFVFGIDEGELYPFLAESGFQVLSQPTVRELEKSYLTDQSGAVMGRMFEFGRMVHALAGQSPAGRAQSDQLNIGSARQ